MLFFSSQRIVVFGERARIYYVGGRVNLDDFSELADPTVVSFVLRDATDELSVPFGVTRELLQSAMGDQFYDAIREIVSMAHRSWWDISEAPTVRVSERLATPESVIQ